MQLRDTPFAAYLSGFIDPTLMGTSLSHALSLVYPPNRAGNNLSATLKGVVVVPQSILYSHFHITYGSAVSDDDVGSFIIVRSKERPGDRTLWAVLTDGAMTQGQARIRQFASLDQVSSYLTNAMIAWRPLNSIALDFSTANVEREVEGTSTAGPAPSTPGNPEQWHCVE